MPFIFAFVFMFIAIGVTLIVGAFTQRH